jgi:hypothetical protein
MPIVQSLKDRSSFGGIIRFILRISQFILAVTVAGLYGYDLGLAGVDYRWRFAVAMATMAGFSVLFYWSKFAYKFLWDFIMV